MAENENGEQQEKKGGMGLIIKLALVLVILLTLLIGGYLVYTKVLKAPENTEGTETEQTEGQTQDSSQPISEDITGHMATMQPFLVNLADPLGRRYLKLTLDVELTSEKDLESFEMNKPKLRDTILLLLSSKTYEDLRPVEAKLELKKEIAQRMNQIMGGKVLRVYFTEIVVQ